MKALFDTGATKSIMSGKMYRNFKLGPLDDSNLPSVVGANGSSLGVMGRIRCTIAFEKDEDKFDQTFLVCENLQRGVILGKDFARQNCAGVYWTPHNTRVLHTNLKTIAETKELVPSGTAAIHVKQTTKLPPRSLAVEETKEKFHELCDRYDQIISKGSADIGKTLLVEMDIDTGDSPPIACRPYTLPLKHHDWVKKEIEILDRAGIIDKSISTWASPVIIVPKKSKPG